MPRTSSVVGKCVRLRNCGTNAETFAIKPIFSGVDFKMQINRNDSEPVELKKVHPMHVVAARAHTSSATSSLQDLKFDSDKAIDVIYPLIRGL